MRGSTALLAGLVGAAVGLTAGVVARRGYDVVEVRGRSMAPTLLPGDRLVVESRTFARRAPRPGELVLAADPRQPRRELVKRVAAVDGEAGTLELRGDSAPESTDSRTFGALPLTEVRWRVTARYWPPARVGRLGR